MRSGAKSSAPGLMLLMTLTSSRMPALMMRMPSMPPNASPCRHSVVPQSPQNELVIDLPESAVLEISLGVPLRILKFDTGTTMLLL